MLHTHTEEKRTPFWKKVLFSQTLSGKNPAHKIAYIAVTVALVVLANTFFEIKFADIQFSLTLCISSLAGIILGPVFGFVACFLGDLVGFLYHNAGFAYMPWIGIAMGMTAFIAGFVMGGFRLPCKGGLYIKLAIVCLLVFAVCTVGINTTAFWLLYAPDTPYFTYLFARIFVGGQIWNSLVNYALLYVAVPLLNRIKPLRLHIV